ncbi:3'-5' DNA helicase [Trapelia coarctata]|nr:3'-5' DNA helicase [Trapelia coarctata]
MSSSEDDEFGGGGVDDEDLMLIATQAEAQRNGSLVIEEDFPDDRVSKRRRLHGPGADEPPKPSRNRSRKEAPGISDTEDYEEDYIGSPTTASGASAQQNVEQETESARNNPKSKYKIHIPKQTELPQDVFYTQLPPGSQSPYRLRGCYWQKPRPESHPPQGSKTGSSIAQDKKTIARNALPNPVQAYRQPTPATALPKQITTNRTREKEQLRNVDDELANLPSDAFSSFDNMAGSFDEPINVPSQGFDGLNWPSQAAQQPRLRAPQTNLRQTTLFGGPAQEDGSQATQTVRRRNWPAANREEAPTHHKLNTDALQTWVYPTNLGTIRDYQFNIVLRGLYHNLLVALPTGLGKTFIAATVMLNWFRWTKDAQIVFVAPTRPLVSQQVEACFNIAGIPRSETSMLTGTIAPALRAEEWISKRVFFMTPQTIINDLKAGTADPKRIILLVVDEAHRATGSYAYVEVVKFLRRFNTSFRVLALTATPGSSVETVQEVIDGLGISRVEIRTEESLDIRQFVHSRRIDPVIFEYSDEMEMVMGLFSKALQPIVKILNSMNAYWNRDPMTLTPYGCTQARQRWMGSDAGRNAAAGLKGMVNTIFTLLASLAHAIELLKFHGIGPFFHKLTEFCNETQAGNKGSKYRRQIDDDENFKKLMTRVGAWINNPGFVGHPKLDYLQSVVLKHFVHAGDGEGAEGGISPANTRIMVFVHYRDSAEEVVRVLKRNSPMIRPHVFVGQANSKGSDGMDQKTQLEVIQQFKSGVYNTLVATSIGEEGLDIGEVDLIVCYDASASPIRMLQRMGRTGRKRAGNIVVLLMKGKEENNFAQAKDNYEKMQQMIAAGTRFTFHEDLSPRIVPRDIQPVVDKRLIDIPPENTQAELPEPKKKGRLPKRPPKKFHMPDGVRTGFTTARKLDGDDSDDGSRDDRAASHRPRKRAPTPVVEVAPIPPLEAVLLTAAEQRDHEHTYLDVGGDTPQIVEAPRMDAFPSLQRSLRYTKHLKHGKATRRVVGMLAKMHGIADDATQRYACNLHLDDRKVGDAQAERRAAYFAGTLIPDHNNPSEASPTLLSSPISPPTPKPKSKPKPARRRRQTLSRKAPTSPPSSEHSAEEDDASDAGSLVDFINDSPNDDTTLDNHDILSSASSPPILPQIAKPFYEPSKDFYPTATQSGDELPDWGTLVGKKGAGVGEKKGVEGEDDYGERGTGKGRARNKGRRVVESDSEQE